MPHLQDERREPNGETAVSNDQLATPALSPIVEQAPSFNNENGIIKPRLGDFGVNQPDPSKDFSGLSVVTNGHRDAQDNIRSPSSLTPESSRILRLSPSQIHELTSSPDSLPVKTIDQPVVRLSDSRDQLKSPTNGSLTPSALCSPPPEDLNRPGQDSDEVIRNGSTASEPPLRRPSQSMRAVSSPLLKRRESASAPRNPKAARDGSATRRPNLTPIKIIDDSKSDDAGVKPTPIKEGVASPMPSLIPLPPMSFPTYLQLELSSEKPSALYIHRPMSAEYPYESSKVKFERLLNFLLLPHQLEQVLWFGTLACLDSWLYSFTILPLRFFKAVLLLVTWWAESLAKEVTELSRFVYVGLQRLWRRQMYARRTSATASDGPSKPSKHTEQRPFRTSSSIRDNEPETPKRGRRGSSLPRSRTIRRKPSGLSANHKADILHGLLIVISCMILVRFDASRMYHSIRGQAAIKLYVIYNVLEVCDRLFSALGQDVLECLFSKETLERKPNGRSKVIRPFWMFVLALVYNVIHATLLFYQVVTLNVAVNSYSNALLTLLMSNQFVEIKGTVFKRFEKENLFQLTCADIVERFQLWLMLSIIASRNIVEVGGWSLSSYTSLPLMPPTQSTNTSSFPPNSTATPPTGTSSLLPAAFSLLPRLSNPVLTPFLIVLGSEMLVDWLKHAYINKFNAVKPSIYGRFLDVLAKDYYSHAFADQNLTKRLGLPTLPLVCLVLRAAGQVWGMFIATGSLGPGTASAASMSTKSLSATLAEETDAVSFGALWKVDAMIRQALGHSSIFSGSGTSWFRSWSTDDVIAFSTAVVFFLILYLFLLAFKLILGMALLGFARNRYKGMKEREREVYDTNSRRVGGWGVTEVDEDKRRWIYQDDEEGLKKLKEREQRNKDRRKENEAGTATGLKLEGVGRYNMVAKRIW